MADYLTCGKGEEYRCETCVHWHQMIGRHETDKMFVMGDCFSLDARPSKENNPNHPRWNTSAVYWCTFHEFRCES